MDNVLRHCPRLRRSFTSGALGALGVLMFSSALAAQSVQVRVVARDVTGTQSARLPSEIGFGPHIARLNGSGEATVSIPRELPYVPEVYGSPPCKIVSVTTSGNITQHGPADNPRLVFHTLPNGEYLVSFNLNCSGGKVGSTVKVKIATTTSCNDKPDGGFQTQGGIDVSLGPQIFKSNSNGVIEADLEPGRYPAGAIWKDYVFGYVSVNGVKASMNENGLPMIDVKGGEMTVEVRMFTCGLDGREKPRAVIAELGESASIKIKRSRVEGRAFVGMYLRDGDTVVVSGVAKIKWLDPVGTISFDDPRGTTIFYVGPNHSVPNNVTEKPVSGVIDFIKGVGRFLIPEDPNQVDRVRDKDGNFIKFRITGPNAKIFIKGTEFTVGYDESTGIMSVGVIKGVVNVEPTLPGKRAFDLQAGQRAEISPSGIKNSGTEQDCALVRPTKSVFAVGEPIAIDYCSPKAYGFDWIAIVNPFDLVHGTGPNQAITKDYAFQFDGNDNSTTERRGTRTFAALSPLKDGQSYEARYISWDFGNNSVVARVPFTVGNAPPSTPPPTNTGNNNPTPPKFKDLTGLWKNPGSEVPYRVRQVGSKLVWGIDNIPHGGYANVFQGQISGDLIDGVWEDLPGSPSIGGGRMLLKVESECRFVKVSSVNPYGADVWIKFGSTCDRAGQTGLTQQSVPAASNRSNPPTSDSKPSGPVVVISDPSVIDKGPAKPASKPPTTQTKAAATGTTKYSLTGGWTCDDNGAYLLTQTGNAVSWEASSADGGKTFAHAFAGTIEGDIIKGHYKDHPGSGVQSEGDLEFRIVNNGELRLRKASVPFGCNVMEKAPPLTASSPTANNAAMTGNPSGSTPGGVDACQGGSFALGTPVFERLRANYTRVKFPWSVPIGNTGTKIYVYRAGTNQLVTWDGLPQNLGTSKPNYCGYGWGFPWDKNPQSSGPFDAYLIDSAGRIVAGPVRFTVYPQ